MSTDRPGSAGTFSWQFLLLLFAYYYSQTEHIFTLKPSFTLHSFPGMPQIHPFLPPNLDIGV